VTGFCNHNPLVSRLTIRELGCLLVAMAFSDTYSVNLVDRCRDKLQRLISNGFGRLLIKRNDPAGST
jgi:hypothetical protein